MVKEKAAHSFAHGAAQCALASVLNGSFRGGWWLAIGVDTELETHEVYLPDLVGWRRERVPERPTGQPVRIRPDWVCEILSPSTASRDLGEKHRTLHRCGVGHYWIVDPQNETLTVQRWTEDGYLVVLTAGKTETVKAEPFEAIEFPVGILFGYEPEESDEPSED